MRMITKFKITNNQWNVLEIARKMCKLTRKLTLNFCTEASARLRRLPEEVPHPAGVVEPRGDAQRAEALRVRHLSGPILAAGNPDSDC